MVGGIRRKDQTIVLVGGDLATVACAKKILKERYTTVSPSTVREAFELLARPPKPSAVVIDGQLADGKAASVVGRVHALYPEMPILVTTGFPEDHDLANLAQAVNAEYAVKPGGSLFSFARRVVIRMHLPIETLARRTDAVAARFALSLSESEVLALAVGEIPVIRMPRALGIRLSTIKTYAQHVREKTGGQKLLAVAWSIRTGTPLDVVDAADL